MEYLRLSFMMFRASLKNSIMKKIAPHRHIENIEIHNRNNYVLTYVSMFLCGKRNF